MEGAIRRNLCDNCVRSDRRFRESRLLLTVPNQFVAQILNSGPGANSGLVTMVTMRSSHLMLRTQVLRSPFVEYYLSCILSQPF